MAVSHPTVKAAPDGLQLGALDRGDGTATFALYAPGKQSVRVIGDFNGWDRTSDPLFVTDQGVWWISKQLDGGTYHYKFVVDDVEISDPYARRLSGDGTPQIVVGAEPYTWHDDGWQRPPFNDLIIYELHVGDFVDPWTFASVTDRLPYLRDLGINAIELLPVMGFGGKPGWGYDPLFFFAPEQTYGSPEDLKQLIDRAHGHGIAVILDVVFAHTSQDHAFNKLYPYDQSPWYGDNDMSQPNQFGFPKLDHTKAPTKDVVRDVQQYWINEYHIDGFRYDYTLGIGYNMIDGVSYLAHTARETMPNLYLIAEESPEKPPMVRDTELDAAWHVRFSYAARALLRQGEYLDWNWANGDQWVGVLQADQQGYASPTEMVNYLESHDEDRIMVAVQQVGLSEEQARYASALSAILLLTAPGVPMLYHGQEWGEASPKTGERNPLRWEWLNTDAGLGLKEHYSKLIRLRREHGALRGSQMVIDHCSDEWKTLVFHRWDDGGDEVLVALNFDSSDHTIEVRLPSAGRWHDVIGGGEIEGQDVVTIELGAVQGKVLIKPG